MFIEFLTSKVRLVKRMVWESLTSRMGLRYKLQTGLMIEIQSFGDWCTLNEVFTDGEYDNSIRAGMGSAGDIGAFRVLDLGANTGFFCLRLVDLWMRNGASSTLNYVGVEASRRTAAIFRRRIPTYPHRNAEIELHDGLVGIREGCANLVEGREHNTSHVTKAENRISSRVAYVNLDSVLTGWPHIDLLKCDIEGSEQDFIATYPDLLRKTRFAVIEFHALASDSPVFETLRACGLSEISVIRNGHGLRLSLWKNEL